MKLKKSVFDIVKYFMSVLNETFTDHGIRVAYIYLLTCEYEGGLSVGMLQSLIFLCMFHDVGAYKTEEINDLLKFEVANTLSHSVYGYLFIKYFSPLSDYAPIILYHHLHYDQRDKCRLKLKEQAMMLNLADRIDICAVHNEDNKAVLEHIAACAGTTFDPRNVRAFIAADAKYHILEHVRDGSYESTVRDYYDNHIYRDEMLESLIMMLSMTIDFKNEDTLSHSIQTAQIAKTLGQCCGIRGEGLEDLYYAGLLHDIGKIKLPDGMLDKDAMLVGEEAEVFRKHPARPSSATECL